MRFSLLATASCVLTLVSGIPSDDAPGGYHFQKRPAKLTKRAETLQPARTGRPAATNPLWSLYDDTFARTHYIDLSHTIRPDIPVWRGFGDIKFGQAVHRDTGKPFAYEDDLFVANAYNLTTDQMGTQLDAPAHFNPYFAGSDEIPVTFALRKLVVIDVSEKVKKNATYAMVVDDILQWEKHHGKVPRGSVVFVRSDWSKPWPNVNTDEFPQVHLSAVQFLHLKRGILFHGHEPLDTDMTPQFDSERWLLTHGYAQAEGVTNLDKVPPTGCLLSTGFPKFAGGTGNYVRYVAICPSNWEYGLTPGSFPEAPLPEFIKPLKWNPKKGYRSRDD